MNATETTSRTISREALEGISSFCAPDAKITGTIESSNPAAAYRLEGTLDGEILFEKGGTVHIARGAKVTKGRIVADHILIEGVVDAKLHARKSLEITANAVVAGELLYDAGLDIHTNARIRASMQFTGSMDEVPTGTLESGVVDTATEHVALQTNPAPTTEEAGPAPTVVVEEAELAASAEKPRIVGLDSIRAFAASRVSDMQAHSGPVSAYQYGHAATA